MQHDSKFKNLVQDFPKETLRWLLPQKDIRADEIENSDNPVLQILTPTLDYPPEERLQRTTQAYIKLHQQLDLRLFYKYVDFLDAYAKIQPEEKEQILNLMTETNGGMMIREMLMEEGLEKG
ncbi:MAG: hypothetical protein HQM14_19910, partial [SAR324 cluster bacterium]|nr:hypothetical protein [SAR324 cluster bacterium]